MYALDHFGSNATRNTLAVHNIGAVPVLDVLKIGWIAKDALKVLERFRVQTLRFFVILTTLVLTIKIFSTYARRKVLLPCIDDAVAGVYLSLF